MTRVGLIFILVATTGKSATPPSPPKIVSGDLLAILMTAEGLLFAALAVGVSLQTLSDGTYLPKFITSGRLALSIFLVITLVAVGAGSTWYDLYGAGFPQHLFRPLAEAVALAGAIAAQPILSFVIWLGSVRKRRSGLA